METRRSILDFWFGEDAGRLSGATVADRQSKPWWGKDLGGFGLLTSACCPPASP